MKERTLGNGLKLGLYGLLRGTGVEPDTLVRRARLAEEVGFESLWVGDHIALPADMDVLARQLSSIDILSKGRLTVGIGVGYVEPELRAMGVSLADRGARTDEYLAAMRTLWTEPAPSFEGRFVSFSGLFQRPLPVQRPHPPIVVGGHSAAAQRRAVTTGNGWYGVYLDLEQTAEALAGLRKVAAGCDRPANLGELEITITPPGPIDLETARRYADLGVHRLVIQSLTTDGSDIEELIESVGKTLVGRL